VITKAVLNFGDLHLFGMQAVSDVITVRFVLRVEGFIVTRVQNNLFKG